MSTEPVPAPEPVEEVATVDVMRWREAAATLEWLASTPRLVLFIPGGVDYLKPGTQITDLNRGVLLDHRPVNVEDKLLVSTTRTLLTDALAVLDKLENTDDRDNDSHA
jgi:hypothetical protein